MVKLLWTFAASKSFDFEVNCLNVIIQVFTLQDRVAVVASKHIIAVRQWYIFSYFRFTVRSWRCLL